MGEEFSTHASRTLNQQIGPNPANLPLHSQAHLSRGGGDLELPKMAEDTLTLAAPYAECGDFQEAVQWQKKAIELYSNGDKEDLEKAQERLKLYEAGKPYREE